MALRSSGTDAQFLRNLHKKVQDMLNKVQKAAFDLIQSDARFIYTLVDMQNNAKNINSNYVMMSIPYIGIFADGAEQWCKKIGLNADRKSTRLEKKPVR